SQYDPAQPRSSNWRTGVLAYWRTGQLKLRERVRRDVAATEDRDDHGAGVFERASLHGPERGGDTCGAAWLDAPLALVNQPQCCARDRRIVNGHYSIDIGLGVLEREVARPDGHEAIGDRLR